MNDIKEAHFNNGRLVFKLNQRIGISSVIKMFTNIPIHYLAFQESADL